MNTGSDTSVDTAIQAITVMTVDDHPLFREGIASVIEDEADMRLLALLKMNLGSADISTMLGISQDSLRIARYRLRKKLNLDEGESLIGFLQKI